MGATAADQVQDITLKSSGGFLGSSLRVTLRAAALGPDEFAIDRGEWDKTLGPVFERISAGIHGNNRTEVSEKTPIAAQNGYTEMTSEQHAGLHRLLQAFATAEDPHYTDKMGGAYAERLQRFAAAYKDGLVIADRDQLEGLTTIARAATEFARTDDKYNHVDPFWKQTVEENPQMRYRHGLLHKFG